MTKQMDQGLLLGMVLQELGGEVTISAESQVKLSLALAKKQLLMKIDEETKIITLKLVDKEEVTEV